MTASMHLQILRPYTLARIACTHRLIRLPIELQVGSGSRSEKIKTYNFRESRVSDHRTKINYDLNKTVNGDLESCISALTLLDQQERLAELATGAMSEVR